MHICASQFSKFPGGACPRTPRGEGVTASPRRDRYAITNVGGLRTPRPPPPPVTQILDPPLTGDDISVIMIDKDSFENGKEKEAFWVSGRQSLTNLTQLEALFNVCTVGFAMTEPSYPLLCFKGPGNTDSDPSDKTYVLASSARSSDYSVQEQT